MNTTKNNEEVLWEDVLYEFSLAQEIPDRAHLEEFIGRYPEFAEKLTEIAVELAMDAISEIPMPGGNERKSGPTRVSPAVSRAMSHFQNLLYEEKKAKAKATSTKPENILAVDERFRKMLRKQYREFAATIGGNNTFANKVRDRLIEPDTIPSKFAQLVSSGIEMPLYAVNDYLRSEPQLNATPQQYKADKKPTVISRESFEDAVKNSGLTKKQQQFLLSLV